MKTEMIDEVRQNSELDRANGGRSGISRHCQRGFARAVFFCGHSYFLKVRLDDAG